MPNIYKSYKQLGRCKDIKYDWSIQRAQSLVEDRHLWIDCREHNVIHNGVLCQRDRLIAGEKVLGPFTFEFQVNIKYRCINFDVVIDTLILVPLGIEIIKTINFWASGSVLGIMQYKKSWTKKVAEHAGKAINTFSVTIIKFCYCFVWFSKIFKEHRFDFVLCKTWKENDKIYRR